MTADQGDEGAAVAEQKIVAMLQVGKKMSKRCNGIAAAETGVGRIFLPAYGLHVLGVRALDRSFSVGHRSQVVAIPKRDSAIVFVKMPDCKRSAASLATFKWFEPKVEWIELLTEYLCALK